MENAEHIKKYGNHYAIKNTQYNIKLGSYYFNSLMEEYNGDYPFAIAAYNAAYNGGAQFGTFANGEDMALKLGFKSFTRGGYTFHKSTYDPFSYQGMLGAAGTNYEGYGCLVPMDTRKDARTGDSIPSLRIRYKEAGGYSREMEHWFTGSAVLQDPTEETDRLKCHYRTERGFEGYGGNRFVLIKSA